MEELGLVRRQADVTDRRVREAEVTQKGKAMTDAVDRARGRLAQKMFASWDEKDIAELIRLVRKLADGMTGAGDKPTPQ